jgi:hypothetical protein
MLQKCTIRMVESFLGKANRTAHNMVSGSRVGTHGADSIPVNRDGITGGAGSWGVSAAIPSSYTEGTLEQVELANKPGALAELAGKLAKKGINIDSAYVTVPKGAKKAVVMLATSKAGETGAA